MIVRLTPISELKEIFIETLLTKTSKVTKVSNESVLSGVGFGIAKVGQRALKDIGIVESHLFPDSAFGSDLDTIAENNGIAPRFGASESSTFVRVVGDVGTVYTAGVNVISGSDGIDFDFEENITIGSAGFAYAKIRSKDSGSKTNVDPLTLTKVNPIPTGHDYVVNEYQATGGRDAEQDDVFRQRIKEGPNILAKGTIASLEQAFNKINNNVLRIFYQGINNNAQVVLAIATQNGINLTQAELDQLLDDGEQYFNLVDLRPVGNENFGILLKNIEYQSIDISFRVDLLTSFNPDSVRKDITAEFAKVLDFRFWVPGSKVEWDDLLQIVKSTDGVRYVPDQFFFPNTDIEIDVNKLPRIRGFLMLDIDGNIISNLTGTLNPVFYPADPDFSFQQTVLQSL